MIIDGCNSTSKAFYYAEVSVYYRQYYYEYVDTLVTNLIDWFDQETMRKLSDAEQFCVYCVRLQEVLSAIECDVKLSTGSMVR